MTKLGGWKMACGVCVLWAATAIASPAQKFTSLHSFDSSEGQEPVAALAQATNGTLYGTTTGGGDIYGFGTVFQITASGTVTTLSVFCSQIPCSNGQDPQGALLQATKWNPLRDNGGRRGQRRWYALPNHAKRHADDAV